MSGVEKIEINLTEDQGAASVCEVRMTGSVIDFQFLRVGDGNILQCGIVSIDLHYKRYNIN